MKFNFSLLLALSLFTLVGCFNEPKTELETDNEQSFPNDEARKAEGISLYKNNCMSCHGDLASSTKSNKSKLEIQDAIKFNSGGMGSLGVLSDLEVELIAEALFIPAPPKPKTCADLVGDVDAGRDLSNNNCMGCHFVKKGYSCESIKSSFSAISNMNSFADYTDQQLADLAAYMGSFTNKTPPPAGELSVKSVAPLADRKILMSKLTRVFNSPVVNAGITAKINIITDKPGIFGGTCFGHHDPSCLGNIDESAVASMLPEPNVARSGYMNRICGEVLQVDQAVTNAMENAEVLISANANSNNMETILYTVFPGRVFDVNTINGLVAVFDEAKIQGMSNTDAWRFVLHSMCVSPMMGAL